MSDLKFRIRAKSENPTKTIVKARNFELTIDEPEELGGTNQGANPVEVVLAGYAGCLNVMSHVCAGELGIKLKGVKIDIAGTLNPDRLFGKPTDDRAGYKEITATIKPELEEDIDSELLDRWLKEVCSRCPVGDNLKNATEVAVEYKI